MKPYYLIALIVVTCLASTSNAQAETFELREAFQPGGTLEVGNVSGSVEVQAWKQNRIEVIADLESQEDELEFEVSDGVAYVGVKKKRQSDKRHRHHRGQDDDADILIRVPLETRVSTNTVSADVRVTGTTGDQRLESVSGDIVSRLQGAKGTFRSVSGEIEVEAIGNKSVRVGAHTVSGDIELKNVGGEIRVNAVSGDIEVSAGKFNRLSGETVSGDIDFVGDLDAGGEIELESINGDIDLKIPSLLDTDFDLQTFNGSISSLFGYKARRTSRYAPGRELRLTEGNGSSRIRIETLNGDIGIRATRDSKRSPQVRVGSARSNDNDDEDDDDHDWNWDDHGDHDHN